MAKKEYESKKFQKFSKWIESNMIECNRDKGKVLHLSPNKPQMHEDQTIRRKKKNA